MNIEELRECCLSVKGSSESLPFLGHNVLVFKVMEKMFAYVALEPKDGVFRVNLKCDATRSIELREKYNGVVPTDFKTLQWNLVILDSDVPDELIRELIHHSVDEVIKKLSKKKQLEYLSL
ncbi:MmcQ/YjbR family DNA-binding protein [Bacteroides reticulotermitis]|uniref:MmcQ/YjbR family DNA-binding protein n=1 Tax=Bacteroides reticulotermitis TaxID=1133319 RepID=UPI001D3EEE2E|nr:MmcQ/YjbR family DNA-binding protein [Bacteroides reticulotermitis]